MLCCALVAPHVSATALQLLASSLDLFHLDSGGNSINGALRPAHSQGIDARTGPRMSFSWNRVEGGAVETSFSSVGGARGLAAVFVSATVDIVPPSSLLPTPSMYAQPPHP